MVFQFLKWLRSNVTEEEFKNILAIADADIKFNRIKFGKRTTSLVYIGICTKCASIILKRSYLE